MPQPIVSAPQLLFAPNSRTSKDLTIDPVVGKWKIFVIKIHVECSVLAVLLGAAPANAANFSFTGNLADSNDNQSFFFTANGASTVNLRSYSYAGGTNAAGTVIAAGGFDPILSLFDGTDTLIQTVDDGPDPVPADPTTGRRYDTNFSQALAAGNYRVIISQYANFATGPNFSNGFGGTNDPGFDGRTSAWAVDVLGVEQASTPTATSVPEPADLLGTVVAGFAVIGLKRKLSSGKKAQLKITR